MKKRRKSILFLIILLIGLVHFVKPENGSYFSDSDSVRLHSHAEIRDFKFDAIGARLRQEIDQGLGTRGEAYNTIAELIERQNISEEVRDRAVYELTQAIRKTSPKEALKLAAFLKNEQPKVRQAVMATLRECEPSSTILPLLLSGLTDSDEIVQYNAIAAFWGAAEKANFKVGKETPGFPSLAVYEKDPVHWRKLWFEWYGKNKEILNMRLR